MYLLILYLQIIYLYIIYDMVIYQHIICDETNGTERFNNLHKVTQLTTWQSLNSKTKSDSLHYTPVVLTSQRAERDLMMT